MVLTGSEARRRFGTIDIVGRTLAIVAGGRATDYRIAGVIQDPPRNSHLALSVVARVDFEALYGGPVPFLTQWMPKNGWVYARLRPGADVAEIARQMPAWERRNIPDQIVGGERTESRQQCRLAARERARRASGRGAGQRHACGQ